LCGQRLYHARQIIGEARRDHVAINRARLIEHRGAGILEIDLDVPDGG